MFLEGYAMTYSLIPRPRAGFVNCSDIFLGIYNTPVEAWPVFSLTSPYTLEFASLMTSSLASLSSLLIVVFFLMSIIL